MNPRRMTQQRLALALTGMLLLMPRRTDAAITCTAVTTRMDTTVTCHFGVDISKSQHNLNVQFYYPDLKATPQTVLACIYKEGGDVVCHEGQGITFDKQISDHIQVLGPPALDKVGGHYTCQVLPALKDHQIKSCELTFKDIPTEPPTTGNPHHHLSETDDNDTVSTLLIVIVVLIVIILGVLLPYVILHWNPQRGRCKRSPQSQDQETGDSQQEPQKMSCFGCVQNPKTTEGESDGTRQKTGCCFCIKSTPPQDEQEKTENVEENVLLAEIPQANEKAE